MAPLPHTLPYAACSSVHASAKPVVAASVAACTRCQGRCPATSIPHGSRLVRAGRLGGPPTSTRSTASGSLGSTDGEPDPAPVDAPSPAPRKARGRPKRADAGSPGADGAAAAPTPARPRTARGKRKAAAAEGAGAEAANSGSDSGADADPASGGSRRRKAATAASGRAASGSEPAVGSLPAAVQHAAPVVGAAPAPLDLRAKLPPGPEWLRVRQWVVFTDLHVKESSLATCLQVLRAVEAEARSRQQAGIMFLGDFWDKRGVLPIGPLNEVLREMGRWQGLPVLMLVGNHDQVDLGGLLHGLTPLELACPNVHVFDAPTLWHGALWLPYRKDAQALQRAMQRAAGGDGEAAAAAAGSGAGSGSGSGAAAAAAAAAAAEGPATGSEAAGEEEEARGLHAIFAHADIPGAQMSAFRIASEGVPREAFPPGLPVYSGHYHLPHTLPGTAITYVGSPYQVSRAEAGQRKRLLVVEAGSWRVAEELPLDVGPRHVRAEGAGQAAELAAAAAGSSASLASLEQPDGSSSSSEEQQQRALGLRPGDVVSWRLSRSEAGDLAVARAREQLEAQGLRVNVSVAPDARALRIPAAEQLDALALVDHYARCQGPALSAAALAQVRAAVEGVQVERGLVGDEGCGPAAGGRGASLELEAVTLEGFGPFKERQTYLLAERGVVVVTGENHDEAGADSNGAGKTTLVTAPLWALTGELLARTESSGSGGRVPVDALLHEGSGRALVELSGLVNGEPFTVAREVKRGKTSGLSLVVGGADLTGQDVRDTQRTINALFATRLLGCAAFFGQNDITALLEDKDADLKAKLGLVVDLQVWQAAAARLSEPKRAARAEAERLGGRIDTLQGQLAGRQGQMAQEAARQAAWAQEHAHRLAAAEASQAAAAASAVEAAAGLPPLRERLLACQAALQAGAEAILARLAARQAEEQAQRTQRQLAAQEAEQAAAEQAQAAAATTTVRSASAPPAAAAAAAADGPSPEEERADALCAELAEAIKALTAQRTAAQAEASTAGGQLLQLERTRAEYVAALTQAQSAVSSSSSSRDGNGNGAGAGAGDGSDDDAHAHHQHDLHSAAVAGGSGSGSGGPLVLAADGRVSMAADGRAVKAVCDRCRQPIDATLYAANVARMDADVARAREAHAALLGAQEGLAREVAQAEARLAEAKATGRRLRQERLAAAQQRAREAEQAAVAALREVERVQAEARQAAEEARRAQQEALMRADRQLAEVQQRLQRDKDAQSSLQSCSRECSRLLQELAALQAAWPAHLPAPQTQQQQQQEEEEEDEQSGSGASQDGTPDDLSTAADDAAAGNAAAASSGAAQPDELVSAWPSLEAAARAALEGGRRALSRWQAAVHQAEAVSREGDPHAAVVEMYRRDVAGLQRDVAQAEEERAAAAAAHEALVEAERALGPRGIPSFALEGALADLQAYSCEYLHELCDGFTLELHATKQAAAAATGGSGRAGGRGGASAAADKEEISKVVYARSRADGTPRPRSVTQLSGGERRRVALAMSLGFSRMARERGCLRCNVLVLDEVLQQLDATGCERVAAVLHELPHSTVLLVGQSNSSVTANFEVMDRVVKQGGQASVMYAA